MSAVAFEAVATKCDELEVAEEFEGRREGKIDFVAVHIGHDSDSFPGRILQYSSASPDLGIEKVVEEWQIDLQ